jgi:hypothetical protein
MGINVIEELERASEVLNLGTLGINEARHILGMVIAHLKSVPAVESLDDQQIKAHIESTKAATEKMLAEAEQIRATTKNMGVEK